MHETQPKTETVKIEGKDLMDRLRALIHEGNVRSVTIRHDGEVIAHFPLTVGVVGTLIAPVAAAIGAMVALLSGCSIEVERETPEGKTPEELTS